MVALGAKKFLSKFVRILIKFFVAFLSKKCRRKQRRYSSFWNNNMEWWKRGEGGDGMGAKTRRWVTRGWLFGSSRDWAIGSRSSSSSSSSSPDFRSLLMPAALWQLGRIFHWWITGRRPRIFETSSRPSSLLLLRLIFATTSALLMINPSSVVRLPPARGNPLPLFSLSLSPFLFHIFFVIFHNIYKWNFRICCIECCLKYTQRKWLFYIHIYNIGLEFTYLLKIEFSIGERKMSKKSV